MTSDVNDIPALAADWHNAGKDTALATVIETWGSAPRPAGSQMVISRQGDMMGSVSGGCVEGAVVSAALEAIDQKAPRVLAYGVSDEDAFAVGLACGGRIRILVEPVGPCLPVSLLEQLIAHRAACRPIAYTVDLATWERALLSPEDGFADRFRSDRSGLEGELFVGVFNPPLRLAVVGGVHIAQTLLNMAWQTGFAPVLIDPRTAFASHKRFPGTPLIHDWPDEAVAQIKPDARTAVVTLTHDPKLDDPAIVAALETACFYIGCLGSKRTHAKRQERLRQSGLSEAQIRRINGPVGLDIGAKSPAEIAVSIMAEIIQTLRR